MCICFILGFPDGSAGEESDVSITDTRVCAVGDRGASIHPAVPGAG